MSEQLIQKGKERDFFNALEVLTNPEEDRTPRVKASKAIKATINGFVNRPAKAWEKIKAQHNHVKAFGSKADIPTIITDNPEIFRNTDYFDMQWEQAYRDINLDPSRDFWEIVTVDSGLAFRLVPEGGSLQVERITGSKVIAYVGKYGGSIGWTDEMVRFRKLEVMQQIAETFRERFYKDKANRHYLVLSTAAEDQTNVTWQGSTGDAEVERDIKTINELAYQIANDTKDAGYGDTANAEFVLYANPKVRSRITRALSYIGQDVAGMPLRVDYNVTPYFTFDPYIASSAGSSTNTDILMVLPGQKIQRATVMEPTTFSDTDILSLSYVDAVWSYYGATAADSRQARIGELA